MSEKKLNQIKIVLRAQGRSNKWLADQLGKNPVTISRWCNNTQQPDIETLYKISALLDVPIYDLLVERYPPE